MFQFLRELFTGDDLLKQCFDDTSEKLSEDFRMFEEAVRSLRHSDTADLQFDIYAADKQINKFEREVRRKVFAHLAVAHPIDVAPGLILISVVNDVERIGDYTKNITELAKAHPKCLHGYIFEDALTEVEKKITIRFKQVAEAFAKADEELATRLMKEHKEISNWCDTVVNQIIIWPTEGLFVGHAVVLALYIRFLKRVWAHLTNIASSVVNPFPRIGYRYKDIKKDE
jgi:phosphate transport system protein